MVQGGMKNKPAKSSRAKSANSASAKKAVHKSKQAKLGSTVKLPNKHHRSVAMEERALSKVRVRVACAYVCVCKARALMHVMGVFVRLCLSL